MSGTHGDNRSWGGVLGEEDEWLSVALQEGLDYGSPLPVQLVVTPIVTRALRSGLPMDVCLSAPTGSGKTLCYLLPMLQMLTDAKRKGLDVTQLRALVLVPTPQLGEQVARELHMLCRGTSIHTLCACGGMGVGGGAPSSAAHTNSDAYHVEQQQLVRGVRVVSEQVRNGGGMSSAALPSQYRDALESRYYSRVDVLVATPRRLLWHLENTPGFSLQHLKLLVVDEADQVLTGNFAALVAKVLDHYEEHVAASESVRLHQKSQSVDAQGGSDDGNVLSGKRYRAPTLHKFLCSATLSTRIARISEVRLRNCKYFSLTSEGSALHGEDSGSGDGGAVGSNPLLSWGDSNAIDMDINKSDSERDSDDDSSSSDDENDGSKRTGKKKDGRKGKGKKSKAAEVASTEKQVVRTAFALPPKLQEHIIFVENDYRHAVLLKLVRHILDQQSESDQPGGEANNKKSGDEEAAGFEEEEEEEEDSSETRLLGNTRKRSTPASEDIGRGILIFCATADEARVMGHFLLAAGIQALEFTTTASEAERRQVLLNAMQSTGPSGESSLGARCVVASDALMRGIDIPDVGHVIMYNPPSTLSQYVHRAGRTARATRAGHVYLFLAKHGSESGKLRDGEMAHFKKHISPALSRTRPLHYERGFFLLPVAHATSTETSADATTSTSKATKQPKWESRLSPAQLSALRDEEKRNAALIDEANQILMHSQLRLRVAWTSAMSAANTPNSAEAGKSERDGSQAGARTASNSTSTQQQPRQSGSATIPFAATSSASHANSSNGRGGFVSSPRGGRGRGGGGRGFGVSYSHKRPRPNTA